MRHRQGRVYPVAVAKDPRLVSRRITSLKVSFGSCRASRHSTAICDHQARYSPSGAIASSTGERADNVAAIAA